MVTYELDKKVSYPGFFVFSQSGSLNTSKVTHTPKTPTPDQNPTLQFNNQRVNLNGYSPSDKLTNIDVYFLKASGIDDTEPFIVVFNESNPRGRTGMTNKRIYYSNNEEESDSSAGVKWEKWEELKPTGDQEVGLELIKKLAQIVRVCEGADDIHEIRSKAHSILNHEVVDGEHSSCSAPTRERRDVETVSRHTIPSEGSSGGRGGGTHSTPVSPGSGGNTTYVPKTPVIIGSAAGGTVGVAAVLSGGGYLWHSLGTRTLRDMMAYF